MIKFILAGTVLGILAIVLFRKQDGIPQYGYAAPPPPPPSFVQAGNPNSAQSGAGVLDYVNDGIVVVKTATKAVEAVKGLYEAFGES